VTLADQCVKRVLLMRASQSLRQMERMLGVTYKTAWFMTMRLREAMRDDMPEGGLRVPPLLTRTRHRPPQEV
jgi:hypothetical protein